jgi:hypothetical protein
MRGLVTLATVTVLCAATHAVCAADRTDRAPGKEEPVVATSQTTQVLTLGQCLEAALQNNHRRPASRFAVAMAEAQHRQALAGYWPQVTAKVGFFRMDEAPDFVFPASVMSVPARAYQNELVDTEKVIRAQLFEALMTAQYLKTRYDHVAIESQISLLVGKEVPGRLASHP